MTIHYHGTPITPVAKMLELAGSHFCISYGTGSKSQVRLANEIGQSVMIDNGAFSIWMRGEQQAMVVDAYGHKSVPGRDDFYEWAAEWLEYRANWLVIPDAIDAGEEVNARLVHQFPKTLIKKSQAAPVWHMDEPVGRLHDLIDLGKWERICIGSSGRYAVVGSDDWCRRMDLVFNRITDPSGRVPVWLHMLRGMSLSGTSYPFASVDSTDVARNHNRGGSIKLRADRWDASQNPKRWYMKMEQQDLLENIGG